MQHHKPISRTPRLNSACNAVHSSDGLKIKEALSSEQLNTAVARLMLDFRDRLFSPLVTLFAFMHQCLSPDKSLVDAIARVNTDRIAAGLKPASLNSAAFSDARKRLPEELPRQLCIEVGQQLEEQVKARAELPMILQCNH